MKTEHTQGPWRVIQHGKGLNRHCVGTENTAPIQAVICEINTKSAGTNDEIRLANARLIAAAPDLLEALYAALPCVEESEEFDKPNGPKLGVTIRALLAQAEGNA
jgi:hypothetical protein